VLELHAIANKKAEGGGEFAVAMTASEKQRFLADLAGGKFQRAERTVGSSQYIQMLGRVDSERSQCSRPKDLETIFEGIRSSVGFEKLNRMVFGVMEEWMVGQLRAEIIASRDRGDDFRAISLNEGLSMLLSDLGRDKDALELDKEALVHYNRKGGSLAGNGIFDVPMPRDCGLFLA
jgi:hypothetical protein